MGWAGCGGGWGGWEAGSPAGDSKQGALSQSRAGGRARAATPELSAAPAPRADPAGASTFKRRRQGPAPGLAATGGLGLCRTASGQTRRVGAVRRSRGARQRTMGAVRATPGLWGGGMLSPRCGGGGRWAGKISNTTPTSRNRKAILGLTWQRWSQCAFGMPSGVGGEGFILPATNPSCTEVLPPLPAHEAAYWRGVAGGARFTERFPPASTPSSSWQACSPPLAPAGHQQQWSGPRPYSCGFAC